ncbi:uncharacterized protein F4822DRAFT_392341 [Hypoxylon trugodes]|uniref:uncharacterized protein n=1 Tax=Hypoxylon trugodes TaxID=326681 RepID=UPI0021968716|nr:uncharacterized protein F4822DRAFT_392341 [Hypoxylon trugodes]KAI1392830.1 hypothetical protein F4822DRAFT_392341 [Hypoxylon trugodes]
MENIRALRSRKHGGRLPLPRGAPRYRLHSHYIFDGDTSQDLNTLRKLAFSKFGRWYALIWWFLNRPAHEIVSILRRFPVLANYHIKLTNAFAKRQRVLAEATGEFFGVRYSNCPRGTEVGDCIFMISGISLLLVLREVGDGGVYRLIGFAEIRSEELMLGKVWWKIVEDNSLHEVIIR